MLTCCAKKKFRAKFQGQQQVAKEETYTVKEVSPKQLKYKCAQKLGEGIMASLVCKTGVITLVTFKLCYIMQPINEGKRLIVGSIWQTQYAETIISNLCPANNLDNYILLIYPDLFRLSSNMQ